MSIQRNLVSASTTFTFLHFGDPQIGMSEDGAEGDGERFLQAVQYANVIRPAFVLISGDLTHRRRPEEFKILDKGLQELRVPAHLIPGNHDILDPDDLEGLALYRSRFGEDYYSFSCGNCEFLCLNSISLMGTQAKTLEGKKEAESQWMWIKETLKHSQRKEAAQIIAFMHIPPFIEREDEPEQYFNLPLPVRQRLLSVLRDHDVKTILAGHTHTTVELTLPYLQLFTVGGTARILDDQGHGFRRFAVGDNRLRQTCVRL